MECGGIPASPAAEGETAGLPDRGVWPSESVRLARSAASSRMNAPRSLAAQRPPVFGVRLPIHLSKVVAVHADTIMRLVCSDVP